jgi:hypothetical protein
MLNGERRTQLVPASSRFDTPKEEPTTMGHYISDLGNWLNTFIVVDALCVALLIALDFWLGPVQRKRLLRKCRRGFSDLRRRRYTEIYAHHAKNLIQVSERWLGVPWSAQFFWRTAALIAAPTTVLLVIVSAWRRHYDFEFIQNYVIGHNYDWFGTARTIGGNVVGIYVFFCISLAMTLWLLAKTERILPVDPARTEGASGPPQMIAHPAMYLFGLVTLDIGLTAVCVVGYLWTAELLTMLRGESLMSLGAVIHKLIVTYKHYLVGSSSAERHYFWTTAFLCLLTTVPTLAHLTLGTIYFTGKAISSVARHFLAILLLRLSQGKDGVLRQFAALIGAIAKLVEVLVKATGASS